MEDAVEAVGTGVRTVVEAPLLVVTTGLLLLCLAPVVALLAVVSVVTTLLVVGPLVFQFGTAIFVKTLLFGSLVGISAGALRGDASLSDATDALRGGLGPSLAGAYVVKELIALCLGVVVFVLHLATQTAGIQNSLGAEQLELVAWIIAFLVAIAYLAIFVTLQFVDAAAVLDGATARQAVGRSYRLTRERPIEVAVYSVLRLLLVGVFVLPGVVLIVASDPFGDLLAPLGWGAVVLLFPFGLAAAMTTHVTYYQARSRQRQ